jgi:DNA-binding response OmpR family regulator
MLKQKHILIVDDESSTSFALKRSLLKCGYKVSVAMNGDAGMEIIRQTLSNGERIDVAIVDILLPGMSGSGLIRDIKKESIHIPVFVVSGMTDKIFLINLLDVHGAANFERAWPVFDVELRDDVSTGPR